MPKKQNFPPIPKMFLAQIENRCSLHYAAEEEDRQQWLKEWIDPKQDGQSYQHSEPKLGLDGSIYRVKVQFPGRVFSNCGRDSIARPVMGKNGIPCFPGSSVKGLFRRACTSEQSIKYCGDANHPGKIRFHSAYPVGNWAPKRTIKSQSGEESKTYYFIEDVVHPQQKRQVEEEDSTTALALISFSKPNMVFEFSSSQGALAESDWKEVKELLYKAFRQGIGGKTSTGYGYAKQNRPEYTQKNYEAYQNALHLNLKGSGVSSVLLSGEAEFRPNLFKAAFRGHTSRLLAGVCNQPGQVKRAVDTLFGSTDAPGEVEIFWEGSRCSNNNKGRNPTYSTQGILHINSSNQDKLNFIEQIAKFCYIMGGFGKSWRRVSHQEFYPDYHQKKFAIGCHWQCFNSEWIDVQEPENLKIFLNQLQQFCKKYLGLPSANPINSWREAWHPKRVAVYSQVMGQSLAVELFHNEDFKTTPAIGGRNPNDKRPKFVSSVWHRMLPIADNQYLEIVTVFHGDLTPWKDQLSNFTKALSKQGLQLTWGNSPEP